MKARRPLDDGGLDERTGTQAAWLRGEKGRAGRAARRRKGRPCRFEGCTSRAPPGCLYCMQHEAAMRRKMKADGYL